MSSKKNRVNYVNDEKDFADQGFAGHSIVNKSLLKELGIEQYKVADGDNFIAIIPPVEEGYFGKRVYVHYDVGVENGAYLCLYKMKGERCPICEARQALEKKNRDPDKETLEEIRALRPGLRYLFWIVDFESEKTEDEGVKLFEAAKTINDGIIGQSTSRRTNEAIDISYPDSTKEGGGSVFTFEKKGNGRFGTRYVNFGLEKREALLDEWLDKVVEFDKVLDYADYNEMAVEFGFSVDKEVEDEEPRRRRGRDDDEEPRRSRDKDEDDEPRKERKSRTESKDETEDDEPRRGRRSTKDKDDDEPRRGRRSATKDDVESESTDSLQERLRRKMEEDKESKDKD